MIQEEENMKGFICIVLLAILVSCSPAQKPALPTQDINALGTKISATMIAEITQTQQAMATPTPEPTQTPQPTPTKMPEPILLSGNGSDVVDVEIPFDMAIAHITGNKGNGHFAIISYDKNGKYIELLANTTDYFEGVVPIGFQGNQVSRFEIDAVGAWSIEILPLSGARPFTIPGIIEGTGNSVVLMSGGIPDVAKITGNKQSDHFAIIGYDISGNYIDLLVNTTDPFEGKIIIDKEISVLAIDSVGPWIIDVKTR
jgi:hypothetical protein